MLDIEALEPDGLCRLGVDHRAAARDLLQGQDVDLGLLESPDRAAWQKPEQIMDVLHVADGSKVADIGAGAGWFTIHLARRVGPNGIVYSQDVQREMLEAIKRRVDSLWRELGL